MRKTFHQYIQERNQYEFDRCFNEMCIMIAAMGNLDEVWDEVCIPTLLENRFEHSGEILEGIFSGVKNMWNRLSGGQQQPQVNPKLQGRAEGLLDQIRKAFMQHVQSFTQAMSKKALDSRDANTWRAVQVFNKGVADAVQRMKFTATPATDATRQPYQQAQQGYQANRIAARKEAGMKSRADKYRQGAPFDADQYTRNIDQARLHSPTPTGGQQGLQGKTAVPVGSTQGNPTGVDQSKLMRQRARMPGVELNT